ncbi:MAG: 6-carboxytetrahydropterin synthase QueD [Elusimicrobiota bacterium]|nr:6-carboxytetrahydropterin synthase QueD [Endomicrobiia bacterium]MCX7910500.1 6-carboxytetrahydropterin synthase QueD [Endomicrobiia bacterium]MDW8166000.1 6-carboxytetrahydropterin synthase QueD [Elusimicrobiota bacterium]
MKYKVYVESYFSSAHYLKMYKGKCENLHGHNWKVGVFVESESLDNLGMVIDFTKLKKILNEVLEKLDHKVLNKEIKYFKKIPPTAENIAKYIYINLKNSLKKYKIVQHLKIIVWETPTQAAIYEE